MTNEKCPECAVRGEVVPGGWGVYCERDGKWKTSRMGRRGKWCHTHAKATADDLNAHVRSAVEALHGEVRHVTQGERATSR